MEEEIKELLKRKDDYDFAYGTQIYKPYTMSEKDWELIENLLTRYKELEIRNDELNKAIGKEYELGRAQGEYEVDEGWKYKINKRLEEQYELFNSKNQKQYSQEVVDVLEELLES